ncbi:MAG TPA: ATP-binding protein [Chloroflexia bacterium]|jgi:hypothetical protein
MDFVDWCSHILDTIIDIEHRSLEARGNWVSEGALMRGLYGANYKISDDYNDYLRSSQRLGMFDATAGLAKNGLLKVWHNYSDWSSTLEGRRLISDMTPLWREICAIPLQPEQEELLRVVNSLSPNVYSDHVHIEYVSDSDVLAQLQSPIENDLLWILGHELEELDFLHVFRSINGECAFKATYRGLAWETKRGFSIETKFIDELLEQWETTSVDFKRELYLDTADQKAEFVKDVLSLVNTQASGRRWMIIGFDDKTRSYHAPPDAKVTQNRIEQLLSAYTTPNIEVRYQVVQYRAGPVGKLEILRDMRKLPYKVAKDIQGQKRKISQNQIFVRHGSQVEEPTPDELKSLIDEGLRASST